MRLRARRGPGPPLPIGSQIDPVTGVLRGIRASGSWAPTISFSAAALCGLSSTEGQRPRGPQTVIDLADGTLVAGWAADLDSGIDSGVDTVHVWAYPTDGRPSTGSGQATPIFVGAADYGGARPDVAAIYGERFLKSGYGLKVRGLAPGTYDLAVFAYSTVKGGFVPLKLSG